ncbi:carboxypeptidase-like regulatory domain-containing protein [Zobellia laminariae]|uniref:carboxypeptidase-like regulatory domain-containing protein n=1 Tax=Zobellia laminariae TaxID=248906 RepID=UPI0026F40E18|nr:carboxypeptidase-like regulatory domain-containing protein [Zobellia laminariae]WKX78141.1 carboxypeptidase-like regulatory domain-containing protein [Zobellia laminariae]
MPKSFAYLFAFFLFFTTTQHAQSLSSIIVDSVSKKPVPYATVQLNNRGMITNEEGKFKFLLSDAVEATDSLFISCIGYESIGRPISEFTDSLITLRPKAIELQEVIVSNKNYTPEEIVELVEENPKKLHHRIF